MRAGTQRTRAIHTGPHQRGADAAVPEVDAHGQRPEQRRAADEMLHEAVERAVAGEFREELVEPDGVALPRLVVALAVGAAFLGDEAARAVPEIPRRHRERVDVERGLTGDVNLRRHPAERVLGRLPIGRIVDELGEFVRRDGSVLGGNRKTRCALEDHQLRCLRSDQRNRLNT